MKRLEHRYGPGVQVLDDPFMSTQLARICSSETDDSPEFNDLVEDLYRAMIRDVGSNELPTVQETKTTRMSKPENPGSYLTGTFLIRETPVVVVDIARAGTLPALVCYRSLTRILHPRLVRQDHLMMARTVDGDHRVTGAAIGGIKVGGDLAGRIVFIPDPMGATGNSLATAIRYLVTNHGKPIKFVLMNLIITPEFIRCLTDLASELEVEIVLYAVRVDRGTSSAEVRGTTPGERWSEETGTNEKQYIEPGGGGFGELMNNSWC